MIQVKNLVKKFGDNTAVNDISFNVEKGEIFGFLGPNGAGKSTTINILCTILKPTKGGATLNGHNVVAEQDAVRRSIGIVFQDPSLDDRLTARENLMFHAMIYGVPRSERNGRIMRVLNMVDLQKRRNEVVKTFSGGMKRRLEIARGLLHFPKVLFLDEPTLGLDPQTRKHIWDYIRDLRKAEDITIFLTTHYMDEAENCSRIAIIDYGKIVALNTPKNLKHEVGGDMVSIKTEDSDRAMNELSRLFNLEARRSDGELHMEVEQGEKFIPRLISEFPLRIDSIGLRHPTLDDVFLKKTGRAIREETLSSKEIFKIHARRM